MVEDVRKEKAIYDVNIPEITGRILRSCNVVRDKYYGSKTLKKHTGVVAGARSGSNNVN